MSRDARAACRVLAPLPESAATVWNGNEGRRILERRPPLEDAHADDYGVSFSDQARTGASAKLIRPQITTALPVPSASIWLGNTADPSTG